MTASVIYKCWVCNKSYRTSIFFTNYVCISQNTVFLYILRNKHYIILIGFLSVALLGISKIRLSSHLIYGLFKYWDVLLRIFFSMIWAVLVCCKTEIQLSINNAEHVTNIKILDLLQYSLLSSFLTDFVRKQKGILYF